MPIKMLFSLLIHEIFKIFTFESKLKVSNGEYDKKINKVTFSKIYI
jgi:hypothetical protein